MEHYSMYPVILFFLYCAAGIHAQTAPAPGPSGPLNCTKILEKAGQFGTLIRLMKNTNMADQINNQLNNSNNGLTVFAPTDSAFSSLSPGTLNSLTDQQKVALVQFHVVPSVLTVAQFQTVSNPLRTQAGDASGGQYPLNVTTNGNQVNITTGIVNTTVSNTIYSDQQLAVYQVDKVLLPLGIFRPSAPPAPAPVPSDSTKKKSSEGPSSSYSKGSTDASVAAVALKWSWLARGLAIFAVAASCFS